MERIDLASSLSRANVDYLDSSIALVSDIRRIRETASDAILMENYLAVIVLNGSAALCVGENEICVQRGDVFVCKPSNILARSMLSMDLEVRGIVVAKDMVNMLMREANVNWTVRMMSTSHDVVHVDEAEMRRLCLFYDLLRDKLNASPSPRKHLSLRALLVAFVNEFIEVMEANERTVPSANHSSAEYLFERFVQLLEDPRQPFVSVKGYADLLHVTPKYFSGVCKRLSGKTANEIICEEVVRQAKLMLRDNSLSIKQIAERLNFANQSHFGTFFRRHTGVSPYGFRMS